jgi:tetratricopeptide (TPR) repeat protein
MRGAAAEMARAHDLAPGNTVILEDYGALLAAIGHADAAIAAGREAVSLDPLGARTFRRLGNIYWSTRHYAEAIVTLQRADAMDTHPSPIKRLALAEAYLANGQPEQALPLCEPIEVWDAHVCLAIAYHALGRSTDAERQLQLVHKELGDDGAFMYAQIHAQWGEPEAALRWLEVAYRLHDSGLNELRSSPYLAPIRDTGGFKDIERRLDFPP